MQQLSGPIVVLIPSHTKPNSSYTVTFPVNAQPYCECKGYAYRRTCSHIKEAADQLLAQFMKSQLTKPLPQSSNYCASCGALLTGTHAFLDKCAACYRHETFSKQEVS